MARGRVRYTAGLSRFVSASAGGRRYSEHLVGCRYQQRVISPMRMESGVVVGPLGRKGNSGESFSTGRRRRGYETGAADLRVGGAAAPSGRGRVDAGVP